MTDFKDIRGFAFDVDGVFTDGGILCDTQGELYRCFDSKDGFALRMVAMNRFPIAIITGGRSVSIKKRFLTCGVPEDDIFLGSRDKVQQLNEFCSRHSLQPSQVLFSGDDIPDIAPMMLCGLSIVPADAVDEAKAVADIVSPICGGKGFIRNVVESVFKAQGKWTFDVKLYEKLF